jgi:DNA adenine methylase
MKNSIRHSPLRYPGGKQLLAKLLGKIIEENDLSGCAYAEPFAGGAGAALSLLFSEHVSSIHLNDADYCVASFWRSAIEETDRLLKLLRDSPITIAEWRKQREVYRNPSRHSPLRVGFATFYLNRTNRSGIISNGGPIGGLRQKGQWRLDARFNRKELMARVERIAMYEGRIKVSQLDAMTFMRTRVEASSTKEKKFVYLDPPYYVKGKNLYLNYYTPTDHTRLSKYLNESPNFDWILTYDKAPEIKSLYHHTPQRAFNLSYSAHKRRTASELLISPPEIRLPSRWRAMIAL